MKIHWTLAILLLILCGSLVFLGCDCGDDDDSQGDDDIGDDGTTPDDDDTGDDDDDDDDDDTDTDDDDDTVTYSSSGWVVGYSDDGTTKNALVWHDDQGDWTMETLPSIPGSSALKGVHFLDQDNGWAVGYEVPPSESQRGLILYRDASGWTKQTVDFTSPDRWELFDVFFLDEDHGWAVGNINSASFSTMILKYEYGTWSKVETPLIESNIGLNSVHFASENKGVAVGWSWIYGNSPVLEYDGTNWTQTLVSGSGMNDWDRGNFLDIRFSGPTQAYAVMNYWDMGTIYQFDGTSWSFDASVFVGGGSVGEVTALAVSPNGTWHLAGYSPPEPESEGDDHYFTKPCFFTKTATYWDYDIRPSTSDKNYEIYDVAFPEDDLGFAVGRAGPSYSGPFMGMIYRYHSGAWQRASEPSSFPGQSLMAVSYISDAP